MRCFIIGIVIKIEKRVHNLLCPSHLRLGPGFRLTLTLRLRFGLHSLEFQQGLLYALFRFLSFNFLLVSRFVRVLNGYGSICEVLAVDGAVDALVLESRQDETDRCRSRRVGNAVAALA